MEILFLTVVDNACVCPYRIHQNRKYPRFGNPVSNRRRQRMRLSLQIHQTKKSTVLEILFLTVVDNACVVSTVPNAFAQTNSSNQKIHGFGNPVSNRRRQRMRLPIQISSNRKITVLEILFLTVVDNACVETTHALSLRYRMRLPKQIHQTKKSTVSKSRVIHHKIIFHKLNYFILQFRNIVDNF